MDAATSFTEQHQKAVFAYRNNHLMATGSSAKNFLFAHIQQSKSSCLQQIVIGNMNAGEVNYHYDIFASSTNPSWTTNGDRFASGRQNGGWVSGKAGGSYDSPGTRSHGRRSCRHCPRFYNGNCCRCVRRAIERALARNPRAACTAPSAGSRQRKCGRCSRRVTPTYPIPPPPHHQAAILTAAASSDNVRGALRAWEGMRHPDWHVLGYIADMSSTILDLATPALITCGRANGSISKAILQKEAGTERELPVRVAAIGDWTCATYKDSACTPLRLHRTG